MNRTGKISLSKAKLAVAAVCAAIALSMPGIGSASLQGKMDSIFHDMTNVTKPGIYNAARRGIISGGGIVSRSPIVSNALWNIQTPHFSAGCGGIDAYLGSFSFINAEQFVALLRAIAANAKGYAFKVALDAASSMLHVNLSELQRAIQALNMNNLNSCELAQGIVNFGADQLGIKHENQMSLSGAMHGFGDFSEAKQHLSNALNFSNEAKKRKDTDEAIKKDYDTVVGNYVYRALKGKKSMFLNADASEQKEYEIIMSITGTVVADPPEINESDNVTADHKQRTFPGIVKIENLINGGTVDVYACDEATECLNPTVSKNPVNLVGLKDRILANLVGDSTSTGLIVKFRSGAALTNDELKILAALPMEAGTIISNLSMHSPEVAKSMASEIAYGVAGRLIFDDMIQYIDTTVALVQNNDLQDKDKALNELNKRRDELVKRQIKWNQEHKTLEESFKYYDKLMKSVDRIALNVR